METLSLVITLFVLPLPVMIAARVVGAERPGYGAALAAVFLSTLLGLGAEKVLSDLIAQYALTLIGGMFIYARVLGTTFVRAFLISLVSAVIMAVIVFVSILLIAAASGA